jgi:hypothetical protein
VSAETASTVTAVAALPPAPVFGMPGVLVVPVPELEEVPLTVPVFEFTVPVFGIPGLADVALVSMTPVLSLAAPVLGDTVEPEPDVSYVWANATPALPSVSAMIAAAVPVAHTFSLLIRIVWLCVSRINYRYAAAVQGTA